LGSESYFIVQNEMASRLGRRLKGEPRGRPKGVTRSSDIAL